MSILKAALDASRSYLRDNPKEIARAARSALGLRVGVPLDAFRWLGALAEKSGKVQDLKIDAEPQGVRVAASVELMGTPIRASAVIYVDRVTFSEEELTVAIRLEEVTLKLNGDAATPVAALIKSGSLDLSNPGDLMGFLPDRSPVLAEARGNRLVLDFMRDPKLGNNPIVRAAVGLATAWVTLDGAETDPGHLDLRLRALPSGVFGAARAVRRHVVLPSLGRLLTRGR